MTMIRAVLRILVPAALAAAVGSGAPAEAAAPVTLAAAGNVACPPGQRSTSERCHQQQTSDLILAERPTAVAALGDLQYDDGTLADFEASYGPTWGRFRSITRPVPGNHDYATPGAQGYFDYFNGVGAAAGLAGDRSRGYYSYDLGRWHLVALNSSCPGTPPAGCNDAVKGGVSAEQVRWLRADLAANSRPCTLAYWHAPVYSWTVERSPGVKPLWEVLHSYGADVILNGHEHTYERFARQDPDGKLDPTGIRTFIVGTGGFNNFAVKDPSPASEVWTNTFGVLFLGLEARRFTWTFKTEAGTVADSGGEGCTPGAPVIDAAAGRSAGAVARAVRRGGLARLRRGLRVAVGAPVSGRAVLRVTDARTRRTLALGRAALRPPATARATVRLTAAGRRTALARAPRRLRIAVTIVSARGLRAARATGVRAT